MLRAISFTALICIVCFQLNAQKPRAVFQDQTGVVRWSDNKQEVSLFGANYCLPSACDYRAAKYVTNDLKKMVDEDMAHFARMGWDGLRLCLWGDYENSDSLGNLVNNDHLNLMDYVIFKAKQRGIYFLFSPIVTYSSQFPDAMRDTINRPVGFSAHYKKNELGTNPNAIAAQQNYLRQILNHVNPYTGIALKDEPGILFIEMINEPTHHSKDVEGSVRYINALVDAVRSTGCDKILYHNYSQDFNMAKPIGQSKVQGVSFAWYPTGLNSGNTLQGNYLPGIDRFSTEMLRPEISKLSRIVYEFDAADLLNGYMYPAMARSFRGVGAQFAAMFSYDMLATAPYNLGWQTHCLNMVYTPKKAVSAIIAAEVMKQVPRYKDYGNYPDNTSFGPFRVSYSEDLSEMVTQDKFFYANNTSTVPKDIPALKNIVGFGSSSVVKYDGKGIYYLDKIKSGVWRLEVYPDAVQISDPYNRPSPDKLVFRSLTKAWNMNVNLPDLTGAFAVHPLNPGNDYHTTASEGWFTIRPGVYILTSDKNFNKEGLPPSIGFVGMTEFYMPEDQELPTQVILNHQPAYYAGKPITITANVYANKEPQSVSLYLKGGRGFPIPMKKDTGYLYKAEIPANRAIEGWMEYSIVVRDGNTVINYPSGINKTPSDWDYNEVAVWKSAVVKEKTALRLINPAEDAGKLSFTRIGDGIRFGIYKLIPSSETGEASFRLELALSYDANLNDYTLSIPVKDKIISRSRDISMATTLTLNARGINQKQQAYITLVENDGTAWTKKVPLKEEWSEIPIPLNQLEISKSLLLPMGYPGEWKYWIEPSRLRGRKGDKVKIENIEWIQLSVRQSNMKKEDARKSSFIDIASAFIQFK